MWRDAGDLPIEQATKFDLIINLKAARRSKLQCREICFNAPTGWVIE